MTNYQYGYLAKEIKKHKPIKVNSVRDSVSNKSRVCVYCGCEIPKGDYYYSYKAMFGKRKARCIEHPPKIYNDVELYDI